MKVVYSWVRQGQYVHLSCCQAKWEKSWVLEKVMGFDESDSLYTGLWVSVTFGESESYGSNDQHVSWMIHWQLGRSVQYWYKRSSMRVLKRILGEPIRGLFRKADTRTAPGESIENSVESLPILISASVAAAVSAVVREYAKNIQLSVKVSPEKWDYVAAGFVGNEVMEAVHSCRLTREVIIAHLTQSAIMGENPQVRRSEKITHIKDMQNDARAAILSNVTKTIRKYSLSLARFRPTEEQINQVADAILKGFELNGQINNDDIQKYFLTYRENR